MQAQGFDLLVTAAILLLIIRPRFNTWPENERGRFSGKPADYVSAGKYLLYCSLYLGTFVLFAYAISQLENAGAILTSFELPAVVAQFFHEHAFAPFLIILVLLLQMPWVDQVEERWRSTLFSLARVPRDAIELKVRLLASLWALRLEGERLDRVIERVSGRGHDAYWKAVVDGSSKSVSAPIACELVKGLYLTSVSHLMSPGQPDVQDIWKIEKRFVELAAVLPSLNRSTSPEQLHEYGQELEKLTDRLVEILARTAVKRYPEANRRHAELLEHGLKVEYVDQPRIDAQPLALSVAGVLAGSVLMTTLGLILFDQVGVAVSPNFESGRWFSVDRIVGWSLGGWVSLVIAGAFGVFFNEVFREKVGHRNLAAYCLAFVFATLGSCIYYTISVENFRPAFVWLSISFGLFSAVVIASSSRNYTTQEAVLRKSLQIAVTYGIVTSLLQVLVHLFFRKFEGVSPVSLAAFMTFGMVRGFAVAFVVSYVFLEHERNRVLTPQRKNPRVQFRQKVAGSIGGTPAEIYIKDLSELGTLARMPEEAEISEGDDVRLQFPFSNLKGRIISVKNHLARIRFTEDDQNLTPLKLFISEKLKQA